MPPATDQAFAAQLVAYVCVTWVESTTVCDTNAGFVAITNGITPDTTTGLSNTSVTVVVAAVAVTFAAGTGTDCPRPNFRRDTRWTFAPG